MELTRCAAALRSAPSSWVFALTALCVASGDIGCVSRPRDLGEANTETHETNGSAQSDPPNANQDRDSGSGTTDSNDGSPAGDGTSPPGDDGAGQEDAVACATPLVDGRRVAGAGAPLVRVDPVCGALTYARYAAEGQTAQLHVLPDYSHAGYMGGGVPLPHVPAVIELAPVTGDNRVRIQAALDEVGARTPDAQGVRGAVLLRPGRFDVGDTLFINHSGVVLRGAGQGLDGTILVATRRTQHDLIVMRGAGNGLREVSGTRSKITSPVVPVGSRSLELESTSGLSPGSTIAVVRTPNQAWIDTLQMDSFGWEPSNFDMEHERIIEGITGNTVFIDVPLVDSIDDQTGGGHVFVADTTLRTRQSGVEHLRLDSVYANATDENHGWKAVVLDDVQDCWVRAVTAVHFGYSVVSIEGNSRFNTVEEVAQLDPISLIDGGRRYSFNVQDGGSNNLFQRCYARNGRHNFVTGARVPGPNVWLDCLSENNHSDEGPHHRWATGMLLDNVKSSIVNVQNRKNAGTGHGWAGAQTLFWNVHATEAVRADAPWGAMNWAIGVEGTRAEGSWAPEEPFGWWESQNMTVSPRSIYLAQLRDRLGSEAVDAVALPAQRSGRMWAQLAAWAGNGALAAYAPDSASGCRGIANGDVCCPESCGTCGGDGCGSRPGGAAACCSGAIRESGATCDEVQPPCIVP